MREQIRIDGIVISNFMLIGAAAIDFPEAGLYLVEGENRDEADYRSSNGSGKSTLHEALVWCFFGKTLRELQFAEDVIHKFKGSCAVTVSFSVRRGVRDADATRHTITRMRERDVSQKLRFSLQSKSGVNIDLCGSSIANTQQKIESVLGVDFKAFCSAVVFGRSSPFKFTSLPATERRKILDDASGANLYQQASDLAKKERLEAEERLAKARWVFDQAEKEMRKCRQDLRTRKKEREDAEPEARRLRILSRNLVGKVAALEDFSQHERMFEKNKQRCVEERLRAQTLREQIVAMNAEAARKLTDAAELSMKGANCPLCGADPEHMPRRVQRISTLRDDAEEVKLNVASTKLRLKKTLEDAARFEKIIREDARFVASSEMKKHEIALLEREVSFLKKRVPKDDTAVRDARILFRKAKRQAEEAQGNVEIHEKRVHILKLLEKSFSPELVEAAIEHAVPELDRVAAQTSEILADGNLRVGFSTQTEKRGRKELGITVESEHGANSYGGSSEGEKATIDLCAASAIQSLVAGGASFNLAFYDEIFDALDATAIERVIALLATQARDRAIFIVTHRADLLSGVSFDGTLRAVKEKGETTLEIVS